MTIREALLNLLDEILEYPNTTHPTSVKEFKTYLLFKIQFLLAEEGAAYKSLEGTEIFPGEHFE